MPQDAAVSHRPRRPDADRAWPGSPVPWCRATGRRVPSRRARWSRAGRPGLESRRPARWAGRGMLRCGG